MRDTSLDDFLDGSEETEVETEGVSETSDVAESAASGDEDRDAREDDGDARGAAAEGDGKVEGDGKAEDGESVGQSDGAVVPAVSTYDFTPEEAPCAACGESVEKRWRDDAGMVCSGCKEW